MRAIHMRKLILIPTIVITGFLALAFVQPAGAAGLVRAVAPGLHVDFPAAVSAAGGTLLRVAARASGSGASSQSRAGLARVFFSNFEFRISDFVLTANAGGVSPPTAPAR